MSWMLSVAMLLLVNSARAGDIILIDDNLDILPPGYALAESASANATATIQIGEIGSSNGLIFDGSWDVPGNGQEFAVGAMFPVIATAADFQLDPADVDGIAGIRWMLDLEVISSTMLLPEQGIFVQLVVFQQQPDGSVLGFASSGNLIEPGLATTLDVALIESDFGLPDEHPDFSAVGRPMSFGLQLGATYPRKIVPDPFFVDGRMTADNWKVEIAGGAGIFNDGFESVSAALRFDEPTIAADENCLCPVPPFTQGYPAHQTD